MEMRVHRPRPELWPFVRLLWEARGNVSGAKDAEPECIPPDGCMELVLNFGDGVEAIHEDGLVAEQPRTMLVGTVSRPTELRPLGVIDLVGVRFSPAGVRAFVDPPAMDLADRTFAIDEVLEKALARDLHAIVGASPAEERIARVEEALVQKLARRRYHDLVVSRMVAAMDHAGGMVTVLDLARHASLTPRQLERRFQSAVGLSPKALAQVIRFQRVLAHLTSERPGLGPHLAAACGYYDQPHLIRDFKRFTGKSPNAFLGRENPFADLFLPDARDDVAFVQVRPRAPF